MGFKTWYDSKSGVQRLIINFFAWSVYWFTIDFLFSFIWEEETPPSPGQRVFKSVFMGVWMAVIFNWKTVREIFGKKNAKKAEE